MLNFATFSVILLVFLGGGYVLNDKSDYSFFDFRHTTILKGIAILLVVWGHVGKVNDVGGIQFIAGAGVSLFLICSGYGLEMSYKKSGLKDFWKKKIINVVIPFYVICIIGDFIESGFEFSWHRLLNILDFRSQWYINYLLVCYVLFWLTSKISADRKRKMFLLMGSFAIWFFIDAFFFASGDAPFLRARQMWAFIAGVAIANNKDRISNLLRNKLCIFVNLIVGLGLMGVTNTSIVKGLPIIVGNVLSLGTVIPLAFAIISCSCMIKVLFKNKVLEFTGMISYEVFLVHTYSLQLASSWIILIPIFVILVVCISWAWNRGYGRIKKLIL